MHRTEPLQNPDNKRGFLLTFIANTSVSLVLAILILAFKLDARNTYNDATGDGFGDGEIIDLRPDEKNGGLSLRQYPAVLNDRKDWRITVASAAISMSLAFCLGCISVFVFRRGKGVLVSPPMLLPYQPNRHNTTLRYESMDLTDCIQL
jgi:hypothetical protein